jgi:hypothetical protein
MLSRLMTCLFVAFLTDTSRFGDLLDFPKGSSALQSGQNSNAEAELMGSVLYSPLLQIRTFPWMA